MVFNSYVFILLLLISVPLYYYSHKFHKERYGVVVLIIASLFFYGYYSYEYVFLLLLNTLWNYFFGTLLHKKKHHRKFYMLIGILGNISLLIYYKYTGFLFTISNEIFASDFELIQLLLPLGISFITFQQIAYLFDCYKNTIPQYSFLDFLCSTVYFPKISQGPITLHQFFIPQLHDKNRHTISYAALNAGLVMFTIGLAKKIMLADVFGLFVNYGYSHMENLNSTSAILVMLGYTLQIYFDFSGYTDMARGISKMFHIDLPMNFNSPYKARSIQDFWNRWHMSLTSFLTHYIYIPLGGNRKGKRRTAINILLVFFISGIWHGANWTFLFWGILHGIWSVIQRQYQKYFSNIHPLFNWLLTFTFLNITWLFFRSESLQEAFNLLKIIFAGDFGPVPYSMLKLLLLPEVSSALEFMQMPILQTIIPYGILFGSIIICVNCKNIDEKIQNWKPSFLNMIQIALLLFWCFISFSTITTFIYFNF